MAVFQRMDVNTLKLRNLIFKNPDESPIPANYQLISKGDGNTVWVPSVNMSDFKLLSNTVDTFKDTIFNPEAIYEKIHKPALSTAISNFNVDLCTNNVTTRILATDSVLFNKTTLEDRVLQPLIPRINEIINSGQSTMVTYIDSQLDDVKQTIMKQRLQSSNNSIQTMVHTYLQSADSVLDTKFSNFLLSEKSVNQIDGAISRYFKSSDSTQNLNTLVTNHLQSSDTIHNLNTIVTNHLQSSDTIHNLNTCVKNYFNSSDSIQNLDNSVTNYFNSSENSLIKPLEKAVNNIFSSDSIIETLFRADNINTAFKTALNEIISSDSILENVLQSEFVTESLISNIETILSSDSIMQAMAIYTETTVGNLSTSHGLAIAPLLNLTNQQQTNYDISNNLSTLNAFSTTQTSTNNFFVDNFSTMTKTGLTSKLYQTFIELEAYSAAIVESSITNVYRGYSTVIASQMAEFDSLYGNLLLSNVESTLAFLGPPLQETLTGLQSSLYSTINTNISTLLLKQYVDPSTIYVDSEYNLSTITNGTSITGLSSFSASIIDLDLRTSDNFYVNLSDIGQNVFYGLTYTADDTVKNRNITLEVDLLSTYRNNYATLDTGNLAQMLSKSTIYAPTQINSNNLLISSFIGKYVLDMRFMNNILHIKNVYTYPYIYSNLTFANRNITFTQNVKPSSNPNANIFMYSGSKFDVTWTTNDLHIPVGVRYSGIDNVTNNRVVCWDGPYSSANLSTTLTLKSNAEYVTYDTIQLMLYPPAGAYVNPLESNIQTPGQIFDSISLDQSVAVVKPGLNTSLYIYNPGTISSFLNIANLSVYTTDGIDLAKTNSIATATVTSSQPFQNDSINWGPQNVTDSNPNTGFRGGFDLATGTDPEAYFGLDIVPLLPNNNSFISSIVIKGSNSPSLSLNGMKMRITNTMGSLVISSLTTLNGDAIQSFGYS